ITFLLLISSCNKTGNNLTNPVTNDSLTIQQILIFDTSIYTYDTLLKCKFAYDGNKRIDYFEETSYTTQGGNNLSMKTTFKNLYIGSDTLPQIIFIDILLYNNNPTNAHMFDTLFLTYQNGIVVRDSSSRIQSGNLAYSVFTFLKLNNSNYKVNYKSYTPGFGFANDSFFVFTNLQNGNLIQEIDTLHGFPVNNFEYLYDNKPNPFKNIFPKIPTPVVGYDHNYGGDVFIFGPIYSSYYATSSVNNMISADNHRYIGEIANYNITYGVNGLPQTAICTHTSSNSVQKYVYQYTHL
ncbi:MAG TPA: hypothetical protein VIV35_11055, partial [Chitinophagaceae bacterium]